MGFVVAAYLIVAVLFVGYVWTLMARQRMITEMADAVGLREEQA